MDDGVHPSVLVDLLGEVPGFGGAGEVTDHDPGRLRGEMIEGCGAFAGAGVQQDLVAGVDKGAGVGEAEPVG